MLMRNWLIMGKRFKNFVSEDFRGGGTELPAEAGGPELLAAVEAAGLFCAVGGTELLASAAL
jgi:hypothetical protein